MNLYEIRGSAVNVYITADEIISRLAFLTARLQQLLCLQFPQFGFNFKLQTCYDL